MRLEREWSQVRMARALGISRSTYRMFIAGRNRAGRKVLGGVARAFPEINVAYFAAADVDAATRMAAEATERAQEHCHGPSEYISPHGAIPALESHPSESNG